MIATIRLPARRLGTTLLTTAAAITLLAAARDLGPRPAKPATLRIVARDYGYEVPATVLSGPTRIELVNEGREIHHVQLLRLTEGHTVADLAGVNDHGPMPHWIVPMGGPNVAVPGDSSRAITSLEPGNYAIVCFIPSADGTPHLMKGMVAGFTVKPGKGGPVTLPEADLTLRLNDFSFAASAPLDEGRHVIRVVNDAVQPHELVILQLDPGRTPKDLVDWSAGGMKTAPPGRWVGGVVGMAQGLSNLIEVDLPAGNYAFICYLPDAKDGMPHFMHGMVAPFTVNARAS